jgi:hypothetical protein
MAALPVQVSHSWGTFQTGNVNGVGSPGVGNRKGGNKSDGGHVSAPR